MKGRKLTIDELRGMDGEWVLVRSKDHDAPRDMPALIQDGCATSLCRLGSRFVIPDICNIHFSFEDYEKTWVAYTYHLFHIDKDAWGACGKCGECHNCKLVLDPLSNCKECISTFRETGEKVYFVPEGFCRSCGRPLTEEGWRKLENRIKGGSE